MKGKNNRELKKELVERADATIENCQNTINNIQEVKNAVEMVKAGGAIVPVVGTITIFCILTASMVLSAFGYLSIGTFILAICIGGSTIPLVGILLLKIEKHCHNVIKEMQKLKEEHEADR